MIGSLADAHNHLHQCGDAASVIVACRQAGIGCAVVNGTHPGDWPEVAALANQHADFVIPSFGLHPWHCQDAPSDWMNQLTDWIERTPGAALGECGLDGCAGKPPMALQIEVFRRQWNLAAERGLPVSIHCVRAAPALLAVLRSAPDSRGFLLHGFQGPASTIEEFVRLGARFSLSTRLLRSPQAATLVRQLPAERILLETDAPHGPGLTRPQSQPDTHDSPHPALLPAVACHVAELRGISLETLSRQCQDNFAELFPSVAMLK